MDTTAIPHPAHRLPVLGDIIGVNPRTPVQDTVRLGRQLGPIFSRRIGALEAVMVSGVDLVTELNDEKRFRKGVELGLRGLRSIAGDGLFTAYDDEPNWRLAHDILMPAFTQEAMRGYHPTMLAAARELLASWDAKAAAGALVDVTADTTRLTLETIGLTGFGYRFASFERDRPHPFVTAMTRSLRFTQSQNLPRPLRRMVGGSVQRNRDDVRLMNDLVDQVIAERRSGPETDTDLLGLMLSQAHPTTGERLDAVNIRNQIITFLVAGHETTSGALSFALHFLAQDQSLLARARQEVDALWGTGAPEPAYEDVARLRYVRRAIDEALRLWPTAPGYFRAAREDTVLGDRYRMKTGDWVIIPTALLHRDPTAWGPDAERFDPDRFAPGAPRRPTHAYKPFGTGARACIGRQFALHEAVLALALIVHRYDLTPEPGYKLRISESLTLKPAGFRLQLRLRSSEGLFSGTASRSPSRPALR